MMPSFQVSDVEYQLTDCPRDQKTRPLDKGERRETSKSKNKYLVQKKSVQNKEARGERRRF